jgi:hypothetical protein
MVLSERSAINANAPGYELTVFGGTSYNRPAQGSSLRGLPNFVGAILGKEVIPWDNVRFGFGMTNAISWRQSLSIDEESEPGQRSVYSVQSEIESFQGVAAVGWAARPDLRFGMTLGMSYDTISTEAQSNAEATTPVAYAGSLNYSSISANTQQLISSFGVQFDAAPWLGLGAVLRPPSVRILGASSLTYDGILNTTQEQQVHFQNDGSFEFRMPLELDLGASTHLGRLNVEANLFWHQASGTYALFSSSQTLRLVTAPPGGASPTVTSLAFPTVLTRTRSILNASIGGNLKLSPIWWLHGGFYVDQSPTYTTDAFFQSVNFYGVRTGCSLRQEKGFEGSIGLGYELGLSSRPPGFGPPLNGLPPPPVGSLNIHTFSILLALGYRF